MHFLQAFTSEVAQTPKKLITISKNKNKNNYNVSYKLFVDSDLNN